MPRLRFVLGFSALLALAAPAVAEAATTDVAVELTDPTTAAGISGMAIKPDRSTVPAGPVIFHVVNRSRSVVHEMIVVGPTEAEAKLPYDPKAGRLIEKKIPRRGEVSDLKPGKSGTLRLTLKPGTYLLVCNEPGHYEAGMKTVLTVTP
jgi:uncharacterized cupredoxin-like copper-binding protein